MPQSLPNIAAAQNDMRFGGPGGSLLICFVPPLCTAMSCRNLLRVVRFTVILFDLAARSTLAPGASAQLSPLSSLISLSLKFTLCPSLTFWGACPFRFVASRTRCSLTSILSHAYPDSLCQPLFI
jgi:hypothetical protein